MLRTSLPGKGYGTCANLVSIRMALAGAGLALAILTALSFGGSTADAGYPGTNGRIACPGLRGPDPAPTGGSRLEIFSVNPDGSGETVLSNNSTRDGDPAYSPDGTKIAFEGRRVPGQPDNSEIYVANNDGDLEGPDVQRLTFNNGELTGGMRNAIAATDRAPSWSPDGTQIVFHSGRETTFSDGGTTPVRDFEIYKMSATTGERGSLTRLTNVRGQDANPSWSPDGTKIAFQSLREGTTARSLNLEVFTMNPDGTGQINVSNNPGTANDPLTPLNENSNGLDRDVQWSPDSRQLVFGSTRSNVTPGNQNFEVFKMNRDGSNPTRLTSNRSGDTPGADTDFDTSPFWSPDGTRILFVSGRTSTAATSEFVVFTMSATAGEAGGLQAVTQTQVFEKCDWQPVPRVAQQPSPDSGDYGPPPTAGCPAGTSAGVTCQANASGGLNITGTAGRDRIVGSSGRDVIRCGDGNDVVFGGPGNDVIRCGAGDDTVSGGTGNDLVDGESGNDRVTGDSDRDRLAGGTGNDVVAGGSANDVLGGGSGNDRLSGNEGADRISGAGGNDRVSGNSGDDRIDGGDASDRLVGNSGNDRISGGRTGNDRLSGGGGNDRLSGGVGRDSLVAGTGRRDVLLGGRDNDRLNTRDRRGGDSANCGENRRDRDRAVVDRRDRVRGCERVARRN